MKRQQMCVLICEWLPLSRRSAGLLVGVGQGGALLVGGKLNGGVPVLEGLEDGPHALRGLHGALLALSRV